MSEVEATPSVEAVSIEAAPATGNGCEEYRSLVSRYDWDVNTMLAIMKSENRTCDPSVNNNSELENHGVCIGSYSLLQVGCIHFSGNQNPNDPDTNISVAYQVWLKQGYGAWTEYRNGNYLKYL